MRKSWFSSFALLNAELNTALAWTDLSKRVVPSAVVGTSAHRTYGLCPQTEPSVTDWK